MASPYIGIIGGQNELTDSIGNYYVALRKLQTKTAAAFVVPFYKPYSFEDEAAFNDYISAADYSTAQNKGVCFGVSVKNDAPDDY